MLTQFKDLLDQPNFKDLLKRDAADKEAVRVLQHMLFELGFGRELNWARFGADGDYGSSTAAAVRAFAQKNGLGADGEQVSSDLARALARKMESIASLRTLQQLRQSNRVADVLRRGSSDNEAVEDLQILLHQLGYDEELNWARFGADGDYGGGTTKAVAAFARKEGIASDGAQISTALADALLQKFTPSLGSDWMNAENPSTASGGLPQGFGRKHPGVFTVGSVSAEEVISRHPQRIAGAGLTESLVRVMAAVSENEGNLEAVNTYDNSFMTFGMFQWTIGAEENKGELAAMLKKLKDRHPDTFHEFFGRYDLDISEKHTNTTYGYLTLRNRLLRSTRRKERLRQDEWAVRFWKAGLHLDVQVVEIEHAASRLKNFYWQESERVKGHLLSELITSEFGVALILDNHVNRPGYVKPCIEKAMEATRLSDPAGWTDKEERQLLEAYIAIRATHGSSPMTHANKRAARTKARLEGPSPKLSDKRGSFVVNPAGTRSLEFTGVTAPEDYRDEDYPEITMERGVSRESAPGR